MFKNFPFVSLLGYYTAPESQKRLALEGQIVHEYWIDPVGFHKLDMTLAILNAVLNSCERLLCKMARVMLPCWGWYSKQLLCLRKQNTYLKINNLLRSVINPSRGLQDLTLGLCDWKSKLDGWWSTFMAGNSYFTYILYYDFYKCRRLCCEKTSM